MNSFDGLLHGSFAHALGWSLVHFVWQGAIIGLIVAAGLRLLRSRSSELRYLVASAGLVAMVLAPIISCLFIVNQPGVLYSGAAFTDVTLQRAAGDSKVLVSTYTADRLLDGTAAAADDGGEVSGAASSVEVQPVAKAGAPSTSAVDGSLDRLLPWLVVIWAVVASGLLLYYASGWWYATRLRRLDVRPLGKEWNERIRLLARRADVRRPVRVLASARVSVPVVVGWIRPLILLPVAVVTGMPTAQVEAILVHELAHIRRYDYLVNTLQVLCEALLFYHPAVWWVSRQMRIERENCCDDVAVRVVGNPRRYARALAGLESLRLRAPRLALAATDGSLGERIRRLIAERQPDANAGSAVFAGLLIVTLFALTVASAPVMSQLWARALGGLTAPTGSSAAHPLSSGGQMYEGGAGSNAAANTSDVMTMKVFPDGRWIPAQAGGHWSTAEKLADLVFSTKSRATRSEALDELEALPSDAAAEAWMRLGESHPMSEVRGRAARWMGRASEYGVTPSLEEIVVSDGSAAVQRQAITALASLPRAQASPSMRRIARVHRSADMRKFAVAWLGQARDRDGYRVMERALYMDPDVDVEREALHMLMRMSMTPMARLPMLWSIAENHHNADIRREAKQMISTVQDALPQGMSVGGRNIVLNKYRVAPNSSTAEKLEKLVFEDAAASGREAIDAIANLSERSARPSLDHIIADHEDAEIREYAREALALVDREYRKDNAVAEATEQAKTGLIASERAAALARLRDFNPRSFDATLGHVVFEDSSIDVRLIALRYLRERKTLDSNAILARVARRPGDMSVRKAAIRAMATLPLHDANDVLEGLVFEDADGEVRAEAIRTLATLPNDAGLALLQRAATSSDLPRAQRRLAQSMVN